MSGEKDKNYVSVGSWMWLLLVAGLPVIGWIMVFVWALSGENETRKNYCRAIIAWIVVLVAVVVTLAVMGNLPHIAKQIQGFIHRG